MLEENSWDCIGFTIACFESINDYRKGTAVTTDCKLIFRFPKNDPHCEIEHSHILEEKVLHLEFKEGQKSSDCFILK